MTVDKLIQEVNDNIDYYYSMAKHITSCQNYQDYVHDAIIKLHKAYSKKGVSSKNIDALMWLTIRSCWINAMEKMKYEHHCEHPEPMQEDSQEVDYEKFLEKIEQEIKSFGSNGLESEYYWRLYQYHAIKGVSMSRISREADLSFWSVYCPMTDLKNHLQGIEELQEFWNDINI